MTGLNISRKRDLILRLYNKDKYMNIDCVCGERGDVREPNRLLAVCCYPCEHVMHTRCLEVRGNKRYCRVCGMRVYFCASNDELSEMVHITDNPTDRMIIKEIYYDLLISNLPDEPPLDKIGLMKVMYNMIGVVVFSDTIGDAMRKITKKWGCEIKVYGRENIYDGQCVIISNHARSFIDTLSLGTVFDFDTLASKKRKYSKLVEKTMNIIYVSKGNTTKTIKKHMDDSGRNVLIYPTGISNDYGIGRFSSGSFSLGYPIQPCIVEIEPKLDPRAKNMSEYYEQVKQKKISIHILEPEFPPFTPEKIDEIRRKMCKAGGFFVGRTHSKLSYLYQTRIK